MTNTIINQGVSGTLTTLNSAADIKAMAEAMRLAEEKAFSEKLPQRENEGRVLQFPDQWNDPVSLPDGLPPVMKLEADMIPMGFRSWIMDIAERLQVPADFPAAAAIVAVGSVIGRGCGIYPKQKDSWLVVPNAWGLSIGRPSVLKSPSMAEAFKPIERLESEAMSDHNDRVMEFETDSDILKLRKTTVSENIKKALKNKNEAGVEQLRKELMELNGKDSEPVRKRFKTNDPTVEKVGELLIKNPRGILLVRDELSSWAQSLNKQGREGDTGFYLECYNGNGGMYTYDRIGRGTLDVPSLCVSVYGGMTPGNLGDYVYRANKGGRGDDGLLQRFSVAVWPDMPKDWSYIDRSPDTEAQNRAWEIFKALSGNIPGAILEEGSKIPALRFSPEAQGFFCSWLGILEKRLRSDETHLSDSILSHLGKYRKLMPALALIFHLIDTADRVEPGMVSGEAALMAAAWCDYLESHAMRIYGSTITPEMESARELVKHIERGEIVSGISCRDISRKCWSKLTTTEEVKAGLEVLQEYDWIVIEKNQTGGQIGGRPSEIVRLNPKLKFSKA